MPQRGGAGLWITGGLAVVAAGAGLFWATSALPTGGTKPAPSAAANFSASSTTDELVAGLRSGDARALEVVQKRFMLPEGTKTALTDAQAAEIVELITAIRAGFLQFPTPGRAAATIVSATMLDRFSADPAPPRFLEILKPIHDV